MTLASILVTVRPGRGIVKELVDELDRQSLPTESFEVVWHLQDTETATGYITEVVQRRPNVRLVVGDLREALVVCRGEYVILLSSEDRAYPRCAEVLTSFARAHDLDSAVGRASIPGRSVPVVAMADAVDIGPPQIGPELLLAVRRDLARLDEAQRLIPVGRCGVVSAEPVVSRSGGDTSRDLLAVLDARWDGGRLVLDCRLPEGDEAVVAVIQKRVDSAQYLLPVEPLPEPGTAPAGPENRIRVALDPRTAVAGRPLTSGVWQVLVQSGPTSSTTTLRPLQWCQCSPALLGTHAYVPLESEGGLAVDAGPTVGALVAAPDPALGVVHESVSGSRLVLSLPDIHTFEAADVEVAVSFGGIVVPATLRVDGAGVRLETLATGVPGAVPLAVQIGQCPLRPTGLDLEVANAGSMRLVRSPRPASPAKAAVKPTKAAAKKPATKARTKRRRPRRGALAAVRRRVPSALEPLVKFASRRPVLKRVYRRFTH